MRSIMDQREKTKRFSIWPVAFPDEKLIVKRPSLRHICQGNTDLGDLISYFLYEIGREAIKVGIDPQTLWAVTLYRTQEEVLKGIDHSTTRKVLGQNTSKLEQIG